MNEVISIHHPVFFTETLSLIEKEIEEKPYQYLISTHSMVELLLVEINRAKLPMEMKSGNLMLCF
jgi:hypothetical protein